LLYGKARVPRNTTYGERLYWIMTGDSYKAVSITHDDVFTLPDYSKTSFFKSTHCVEVVDTRKFWNNYAATSTS